jgi:hypothetical protein
MDSGIAPYFAYLAFSPLFSYTVRGKKHILLLLFGSVYFVKGRERGNKPHDETP